MIKLTQSICTAVNGDQLMNTAPKKAIEIATMLTVSWNCKNFLMQSNMFLPYLTAVTMLLKLSSRRMIPAAYLATWVPAIPIANPMSAFLSAGASFVPSPVIATTLSSCFSPVASKYLSVGELLARTRSCLAIFLKTSMFFTTSFSLSPYPYLTSPPTRVLNSLPSKTTYLPNVFQSPSGFMQFMGRIPASLAIATAVSGLSPVTILTMIPAFLHVSTASGIQFLRGSLIPIRATMVISVSKS